MSSLPINVKDLTISPTEKTQGNPWNNAKDFQAISCSLNNNCVVTPTSGLRMIKSYNAITKEAVMNSWSHFRKTNLKSIGLWGPPSIPVPPDFPFERYKVLENIFKQMLTSTGSTSIKFILSKNEELRLLHLPENLRESWGTRFLWYPIIDSDLTKAWFGTYELLVKANCFIFQTDTNISMDQLDPKIQSTMFAVVENNFLTREEYCSYIKTRMNELTIVPFEQYSDYLKESDPYNRTSRLFDRKFEHFVIDNLIKLEER